MKISVITVVYNGGLTIEQTIQSVLSQSYTDIEYIVIDGASTDNTLDIIDQYRDKIDKIISEPDQGIYAAMNKGIALASGDVIGFLNADDTYHSGSILEKIADCLSDPKIDACYADLVYVSPTNSDRIMRYWKSRDYYLGLHLSGWMPAHPTFYVKRPIYDRFGDFDINYTLQSDFELTMRFMHVHKISTKYIPEVFVRMRSGGASNQSLRNIIRGNIEAYQATKKHKLGLSWFFVVRKIYSRLKQFVVRPENAK